MSAATNSRHRRRFVQVMALSGRLLIAFQPGVRLQQFTSARQALLCDHRGLLRLKAAAKGQGFVFDALTALYAAHHSDLELLQGVLDQSPMLLTSTCNLKSHLPAHLVELRAYADKAYAVADVLAWRGDNDALQWLHDKRVQISWKAYAAAAAGGHLHTLEWLSEHCPLTFQPKNVMIAAARHGDLQILNYLQKHGFDCSQRAIDDACLHNHLEAAQWMHEVFDAKTSQVAFDHFASQGNLAGVEWIRDHNVGPGSMVAAVGAAANGHLQMLKWLRNNPIMITGTPDQHTHFSWAVLEAAVSNGRLETVSWLIETQRSLVQPNAIRLAAGKGNVEILKLLLSRVGRIKGMDQATSILSAAVQANDVAATRLILAKTDDARTAVNADLARQSCYGSTAPVLFTAASAGNREMCALLLEHGADPNRTTTIHHTVTETRTPLMMAAERGHVDVVELLLQHGATAISGVLRSAACSKRPEVLQLVLDQELDTDRMTSDIRGALNYACLHGSEEMVNMLMQRFHGNVILGRDLLASAVQGRNIRVVERVLNGGADANESRAIIAACELHDLATVGMLVSYGGIIPEEGLRAFLRTTTLAELMFTNDNAVQDLLTLVRYYRSCGSTLSEAVYEHLIDGAASIGRGDIVNALLRSPDMPPETNPNPMVGNKYLLHVAAMEGWTDVVQFLCAKLPDVDVIACGSTPLHFALTRRTVRADIVSLLLDAQANWTRRTAKNQSPLSAALKLPIRTCLNMLILFHGHKDGKSPKEVAAVQHILETAGIVSSDARKVLRAYHVSTLLESPDKLAALGLLICQYMFTLFGQSLLLDDIVEGFSAFRS